MTAFPPPGDPGTPSGATTGDAVDHARDQQIVGVSFDKVTRADEVLLAMTHLHQEGEIAIADAVVVAKDDSGRVHVRQTVDPTPGRMAMSGSLWGMLVGAIIGGPVFWLGAAVGAGSAALIAKLVDLGLDDNWIKDVGNWLDPGTSALLLLVADDVRPAVVRELGRYEGTVLYCTFPQAVRDELERALAHQPPPPAPLPPAATEDTNAGPA